jgi:hypothetical protein
MARQLPFLYIHETRTETVILKIIRPHQLKRPGVFDMHHHGQSSTSGDFSWFPLPESLYSETFLTRNTNITETGVSRKPITVPGVPKIKISNTSVKRNLATPEKKNSIPCGSVRGRLHYIWVKCVFLDYDTAIAKCPVQWPRGLRSGDAAAKLLGLRVRIPPGDRCLSFVSVVCLSVVL